MEYVFCFHTGECRQELIFCNRVLIFLCNKDIFFLDTQEDVTEFHLYAFCTAFDESRKFFRLFIGTLLQ